VPHVVRGRNTCQSNTGLKAPPPVSHVVRGRQCRRRRALLLRCVWATLGAESRIALRGMRFEQLELHGAGGSLVGSGGISAVAPGVQPAGQTNTCFWGEPGANVGQIDKAERNRQHPRPGHRDRLLLHALRLPAGADVVLHGQFPHDRFISLTTYKTVNGGALAQAAVGVSKLQQIVHRTEHGKSRSDGAVSSICVTSSRNAIKERTDVSLCRHYGKGN
jgi:hypothetical protein